MIVSCRSCAAPIFFAKSERGRKIPLDFEPYEGDDPRGLFVLRGDVAIAVPPEAFDDEPLYRSHFATCRDAEVWRRRTEPGEQNSAGRVSEEEAVRPDPYLGRRGTGRLSARALPPRLTEPNERRH